ncbi:aminoacyl-tRNA hydrolase [Corynebacterium lizhenjunii]|uniref:Peptidyl-tRNA hydrolase n=1 Tax=Corynebacterium lizhenjunii TaxID=2709394 RepID=A0A7T0KGU1_9CORY|nr:aminoacyl-tRNA hydrolase [Corynebacterium lizhenjunii]QPK79855.1 aminoacyl-tRNA hydrolase [Corynebacterium lizhenjunii]
MATSPVLIVGLGNPGPRYAGTRHNIGTDVVAELVQRAGSSLSVHKKTNTEVAQLPAGRLLARPAIVAKPRSFMNLSGGPVKALAAYYGVAPADLIVIHDELELDFGAVRLRAGGGDHGHNGLRSITKALGTKDYQRLAVGIGRPPGRMDPASFVLKAWSKQEAAEIPILCADAADEILRAHG